jgi:UDP-2-acetamido-3-amino-2,3-dideoxy-glucuronate N-acetyltransferase
VIAAPVPVHADLALRALAAGKHVFVEKPLAMTVEEAQAVVEAGRKARRVVFVGHVLLYHPGIVAMLDAIRDGRIGDVRHLRSRRLSWGRLRAHENVWWSFAPHDIALMHAIMGKDPVSVTRAQSDFVRAGIADFAYADYAFADGRSAHIEVSWLDPDKSSRVDVFGSEGTLTLVDSREGAQLTLAPCGDRIGERGEPELWRGEAQSLTFPSGEPLRLELEAFCAAVTEGRRVPTDGEEGLAVVRALAMDTAASHPSPVRPLVLEALAQ